VAWPTDAGNGAHEVTVGVLRAQALVGFRPLGGDASAAYAAAGLHVEDVRESERTAISRLSVPGAGRGCHVEVFMQPAIDGAAEHEGERMRRHAPSSVRKLRLVRKMRAAS